MAERELNPNVAAEKLNTFVELGLDLVKEYLDYGLRNWMQSGYPLGATPYQSKDTELQALQQRHERNLEVLFGQYYEGDRIRAERELLREKALTEAVTRGPLV